MRVSLTDLSSAITAPKRKTGPRPGFSLVVARWSQPSAAKIWSRIWSTLPMPLIFTYLTPEPPAASFW